MVVVGGVATIKMLIWKMIAERALSISLHAKKGENSAVSANRRRG